MIRNQAYEVVLSYTLAYEKFGKTHIFGHAIQLSYIPVYRAFLYPTNYLFFYDVREVMIYRVQFELFRSIQHFQISYVYFNLYNIFKFKIIYLNLYNIFKSNHV